MAKVQKLRVGPGFQEFFDPHDAVLELIVEQGRIAFPVGERNLVGPTAKNDAVSEAGVELVDAVIVASGVQTEHVAHAEGLPIYAITRCGTVVKGIIAAVDGLNGKIDIVVKQAVFGRDVGVYADQGAVGRVVNLGVAQGQVDGRIGADADDAVAQDAVVDAVGFAAGLQPKTRPLAGFVVKFRFQAVVFDQNRLFGRAFHDELPRPGKDEDAVVVAHGVALVVFVFAQAPMHVYPRARLHAHGAIVDDDDAINDIGQRIRPDPFAAIAAIADGTAGTPAVGQVDGILAPSFQHHFLGVAIGFKNQVLADHKRT